VRVSDFHFDLPEELIAQHPPAERGASRMLVVKRGNREQGTGNVQDPGDSVSQLVDAWFRELPEFLRRGDLLVLNDSRVLPARLFAVRAGLATQANSPGPSGQIEVLLVEEVEGGGVKPTSQERDVGHPTRWPDVGHPVLWRALVRPAKKVRVGETLNFFARDGAGEAVLTAEVVAAGEFGERTLRFAAVEDFYERVGRIGHMPLPPYIRRDRDAGGSKKTTAEILRVAQNDDAVGVGVEAEDRERYQTVYSNAVGSAAAPTAGLHFTPEILADLADRGVEIAYLTLHVGLGTFQPVRVAELKDIRLHAERYTLPVETAAALNRAVAEGRRVIAVGTTTTRTLEHIAAQAVGADEGHVPGAKARVDSAPVMPGLKSRPISKPSFSAGIEARVAGESGLPGLKSWPTLNADGSEVEGVEGSVVFEAHSGVTSIFIGPGHRFRVVSGLLTNFHLPESTLLMLVSAFAAPEGQPERGRETVLAAYAHAIREGYRFYSYGDCMLVL
jgi:S-adenosylmethionine:tRNA ribosyltransferase-isomerase